MTAFASQLAASTRAEVHRLGKWPVTWVIVGVWLVLTLMFGYAFDYLAYRSGGTSFTNETLTSAQLLAGLVPAAIPDVLVQGLPMFGSALILVLGAVAGGSGFGWGTWKSAFTQGPSRIAVVGGSLVAVSLFVAGVLVADLVIALAASSGIAAVEGASLTLPEFSAVAQSMGAGLLVLEMAALLGYAIAVLARGPALAVGLGLVWFLVVENLLRGVGNLLSFVQRLTDLLPGTASGSLVGALVDAGGNPDSTPGVLDALSGPRALVTISLYVVGAVVVTLVVMRRRDVE